jgi:hypothetical protein
MCSITLRIFYQGPGVGGRAGRALFLPETGQRCVCPRLSPFRIRSTTPAVMAARASTPLPASRTSPKSTPACRKERATIFRITAESSMISARTLFIGFPRFLPGYPYQIHAKADENGHCWLSPIPSAIDGYDFRRPAQTLADEIALGCPAPCSFFARGGHKNNSGRHQGR